MGVLLVLQTTDDKQTNVVDELNCDQGKSDDSVQFRREIRDVVYQQTLEQGVGHGEQNGGAEEDLAVIFFRVQSSRQRTWTMTK